MAPNSTIILNADPYRRYRRHELRDKVLALAPKYFSGPGKVSCEDAKSEITISALAFIEEHPYNPRRLGRKSKQPASVNTYVRNVLNFCRQSYFKLETQKRQRSLDGHRTGQDVERASFAPDPLSRAEGIGEAEISNVYLLLGGKVGTPPWKVQFTSPSEPCEYRKHPLYVPPFDLVPQDEDRSARVLTSSGRWVRARSADLTYSQLNDLVKHSEDLQMALVNMFREYLYSYGFRTLKPVQKKIVAKVNKDRIDLKQVARDLGLGKSDFSRHLDAMVTRGWRMVLTPRPGEKRGTIEYRPELVYHPACDGQRGAFARRVLEDIDLPSLHERIMLVSGDVDHLIAGEEWTPRDVERILGKAHGILIEKGTDLKGEQDYDDRFREFIKRFVERPIITKGLDIVAVERLIITTPRDRMADLMERAISGRKSLADCMGLTEHFPEIQSKREGHLPTLMDVMGRPLRRAA